MIERVVTLLPQPDSPTRPRISPRSTWKSTPSTARTRPSRVLNDVRRPLTSSSRSPRGRRWRWAPGGTSSSMIVSSSAGPSGRACRRRRVDRRSSVEPRVERVAQAVAEQVEAEHVERDRDAGEEDQVRRREDQVALGGRSSSPTRPSAAGRRGRGTRGPRPRGRPSPMPSVPCDDRAASARWAARAGMRMPRGRLAERARRGHEVRLADRQHRCAHDAGVDRDRHDADGELGVDEARARGR